ncbi:hypothetical protein Tco_0875009 [Tanacetum coccineum]|uniref:Eukaryotic translation initiation factor 3 subunit G N-terminal domain-containing protein n=1 Tax=Tanacetum coccineum TaxID=301880 RepID=A0ABQ5BR96_9ASTR
MISKEAGYIAASEAAMEAVWMRKFIDVHGVVPTNREPMEMLCDNTGAISIANEPNITKGSCDLSWKKLKEYTKIWSSSEEVNSNSKLPDTCMDIAKIIRKRSNPDKHEHGNRKSAQEPEVSSKSKGKTSPSATIGQDVHKSGAHAWAFIDEYLREKVIKEYLVKVNKRRAFWSLNEDILKITILKTNTPYPSRRYGVCVPELTKDHEGNKPIRRIQKKVIRRIEDICMTRSSTSELFTPYKEPEREFRSSIRHLKTLSLDELRSPSFNLFSKQEYLEEEEEVEEPMAETMEEYMSKTRVHYGSGFVRPKIEEKDSFELKGQFLKELRSNTLSGSDHEDANEHIEKVLEIVDLFHIPNITVDQKVVLFYNGLDVPTRQILDSRGAIPSNTVADAKVAIQEIVEYSQKWHNETFRARSTETSDRLAAIQAQLNNLGSEIKKVNEKVYATQVGCEQCKGPHYTKDCPLKEEGKTLKEAYYTQFRGGIEQQLIVSTKGTTRILQSKNEGNQ